jgi:hypothetical protein
MNTEVYDDKKIVITLRNGGEIQIDEAAYGGVEITSDNMFILEKNKKTLFIYANKLEKG